MLRIRFDNERVTVTHNKGADILLQERYDNVAIEFANDGFWHAIPEPAKALKAALLVLALARLLSGGTEKERRRPDGV